jgi:Na+-driven multidrug efflux pump
VVEVASHFLRVISWNFAAQGIIFTCSGIFQGLGHTWPALASTASRVFTFMLPAIWLSTLPGLELDHVWYVSVASVWLQAALSLLLLRRTMRVRLA